MLATHWIICIRSLSALLKPLLNAFKYFPWTHLFWEIFSFLSAEWFLADDSFFRVGHTVSVSYANSVNLLVTYNYESYSLTVRKLENVVTLTSSNRSRLDQTRTIHVRKVCFTRSWIRSVQNYKMCRPTICFCANHLRSNKCDVFHATVSTVSYVALVSIQEAKVKFLVHLPSLGTMNKKISKELNVFYNLRLRGHYIEVAFHLKKNTIENLLNKSYLRK